jgi:hypothetical protein
MAKSEIVKSWQGAPSAQRTFTGPRDVPDDSVPCQLLTVTFSRAIPGPAMLAMLDQYWSISSE